MGVDSVCADMWKINEFTWTRLPAVMPQPIFQNEFFEQTSIFKDGSKKYILMNIRGYAIANRLGSTLVTFKFTELIAVQLLEIL